MRYVFQLMKVFNITYLSILHTFRFVLITVEPFSWASSFDVHSIHELKQNEISQAKTKIHSCHIQMCIRFFILQKLCDLT